MHEVSNKPKASFGLAIVRRLFWALCAVGKPFGGIRPRRVYHWLARVGFLQPNLAWHQSIWGYELELSPYYYIDRMILFAGCYEAPLHRFLRRHIKPGMVCMDVGANIGDLAVHMGVLVGQEGTVYAFEPADCPRERLMRNLAKNGLTKVVRVHSVALSDKNGTRAFAVADDALPNQGMGSLVNTASEGMSRVTQVRCQTLDDFVSRNNIKSLDIVKVDIQGAEPLFLRGASATLQRLRPWLLMEVSQADLGCAGSSAAELLATLKELGYGVHYLRDSGLVGGRVPVVAGVPADYFISSVACVPR